MGLRTVLLPLPQASSDIRLFQRDEPEERTSVHFLNSSGILVGKMRRKHFHESLLIVHKFHDNYTFILI
jgi:hypothetical protein